MIELFNAYPWIPFSLCVLMLSAAIWLLADAWTRN